MPLIRLWSPLTFSSVRDSNKLQAALKSCKFYCRVSVWSILFFPLPLSSLSAFSPSRACTAWAVRMLSSCQQSTATCSHVLGPWFGMSLHHPAQLNWRAEHGFGRLRTAQKSPGVIWILPAFPQLATNLLLLWCWDFSSNEIKFCVSDEKKINYFILLLWRGETKSWLYFWEPF